MRVSIALVVALLLVATPTVAYFLQASGGVEVRHENASVSATADSSDDADEDASATSASSDCCTSPEPGEVEPCCEAPERFPAPEPCCPRPEPCCREPGDPSMPPEPCCRFSFHVSPYRVGIAPGQSHAFDAMITNHGREPIRVTVEHAGTAPGWSGRLAMDHIGVGAGETRSVTYKLLAPTESRAPEGWGLVRAFANGERHSTQYGTAGAFVLAAPERAVSAVLNPEHARAAPGSTIEFTYAIRNDGSRADSYNIALRTPPGTRVNATHTGAYLEPGESIRGIARIHVGDYAESGAVTLHVEGRSGASAKAQARLEVVRPDEPAGVTMSVRGPTNATAGDTVHYILEVRNGHRENRTVSLRGVAPEGWNATVNPEIVRVNPGESTFVRLTVKIPACESSGTYRVGAIGHVHEDDERVAAFLGLGVWGDACRPTTQD